MPNVKKIRGLNLPGTPWATSVCCGMTFTFIQKHTLLEYSEIRCMGAKKSDVHFEFDLLTAAFLYVTPFSLVEIFLRFQKSCGFQQMYSSSPPIIWLGNLNCQTIFSQAFKINLSKELEADTRPHRERDKRKN